MFQAYIFWELVGLCSYLLIGFWYWKNSASKAAYKAFIVNRAGDFGFLLGMIALGIFTFNYWLNSDLSFLSFSDLNMAVFYLKDVIGDICRFQFRVQVYDFRASFFDEIFFFFIHNTHITNLFLDSKKDIR